MQQHLMGAFEFIEQARRGGGKCLVHCVKGVNRSGFIAVAFSTLHRRVSFSDANISGGVLGESRPGAADEFAVPVVSRASGSFGI